MGIFSENSISNLLTYKTFFFKEKVKTMENSVLESIRKVNRSRLRLECENFHLNLLKEKNLTRSFSMNYLAPFRKLVFTYWYI